MLVIYNDLLNDFRCVLNDDIWTKDDIKDYVEYLKEEYELNDFICRRLQDDFEQIFDREYVEVND